MTIAELDFWKTFYRLDDDDPLGHCGSDADKVITFYTAEEGWGWVCNLCDESTAGMLALVSAESSAAQHECDPDA